MANPIDHMSYLPGVLENDRELVELKEGQYQGSWKKRGGCGAFMVLARKWDRLEAYLEGRGWDIFGAALDDEREEGLRSDIQDLRCYLALVEAELRRQETVLNGET